MTTAMQAPPRRRTARLQEASLIEGPMLLLQNIRGFRSHRSLMWLACVPIALLGLGFFFACFREAKNIHNHFFVYLEKVLYQYILSNQNYYDHD